VDLNNDRHSKIINKVTNIREELKVVRAYNERIIKTQKEINSILLEKLCNRNTDKNKGQNYSNSKIAQPKKKERKLEYVESERETVYKDMKDTKKSIESSSSSKQRTKKKPKQHD